jgi:diguanylate cyclase (GGDEF)-like protein
MTTPSRGLPKQRTLRGRLLVVGGTAAAREFASLARKFVPAVSEATSMYVALADIAASTAREPIAAVAISSDAEGFDADIVCQAFNMTDSSIPVVLLFPQDDVDLEAIGAAAGFEELIPLPACADDVTRVFTDLGLIDTPRDRANSQSQTQKSQTLKSQTPSSPPSIPLPSQVVDLHVKRALAQVHPESDPDTASMSPPSASASTGKSPPSLETRAAQTTAPKPAPTPESVSRHTPERTTAHPRESAAVQPKTTEEAPAFSPDAQRVARRRRTDGHPNHQQVRDPEQSTLSESATHPSAAEEPSDLDLLRALRRGNDLLPVALSVLRAHLACSDLRYAAPTRLGEEHLVRDERARVHVAEIRGETSLHGELLSATCDAAVLANWAAWLAEWLDFEQLHLMQRKLVWSDDLTGAGNRRALYDFAPRALQQAREERRHVSLMVFDIDNFKQYNDAYGHETGDEVLRETVAVMRECIRPGDHVFRLGGDEFVVLFCDPGSGAGPDAVPESVPAIAERCRTKLASTRTPIELLGQPGPGSITLSAGCATFPWDGRTLEELLRCADTRAMQAKRDGKNLINFGPDTPVDP